MNAGFLDILFVVLLIFKNIENTQEKQWFHEVLHGTKIKPIFGTCPLVQPNPKNIGGGGASPGGRLQYRVHWMGENRKDIKKLQK